MKKILWLFFTCSLLCILAGAQNGSQVAAAPGSSLPGLGGIALGLDGPGFIEFGGGHSSLSGPSGGWNDFYLRGAVSGGHNIFNLELTREARFDDSGWFYGLGVTRTVSENWYAQISAGGSAGDGFFIPRFRTDGLIYRKLLRSRELVLTAGLGYDQSKTINYDLRGQIGATYYFQFPVVLQGGLTWTHASPGHILARSQFIAATEGHDKEHFVSLRYEWGREGYELIGPPSFESPAYNVLFDFPMHNITGTWRQWVGPNWGVNLNVEQQQEPAYHRWGGTAGVFIDF